MSTFDTLNELFPNQFYFYQYLGGDMNSALELCARLTGDSSHVVQRDGNIYFAVAHNLGSDIPYLRAVDGQPIDVTPVE
jgi:hypothetical protein